METLPDIKTLSGFHKAITKHKPPLINSLKKTDGTFSTPGHDTAKVLTKAHFPKQRPLMKTTYSNTVIHSYEIHTADYNWISDELTVEAMSGFQAKKSPGPDGLKPIIFPYN